MESKWKNYSRHFLMRFVRVECNQQANSPQLVNHLHRTSKLSWRFDSYRATDSAFDDWVPSMPTFSNMCAISYQIRSLRFGFGSCWMIPVIRNRTSSCTTVASHDQEWNENNRKISISEEKGTRKGFRFRFQNIKTHFSSVISSIFIQVRADYILEDLHSKS